MVAKSFQNLEQTCEPFVSKGRWYVRVRTNKGIEKTVRWYSDAEYARMYPNEPEAEEFKRIKPQKEVLGFTNGYITIFKGNTYEEKDYFKLSSARYSRLWGWYFISTEELPKDIPEDVEPITLPWEMVGNSDESLKNESEVIEAVESLIYDPGTSEFQGEIGERLELILTVEKAIELEGYYGRSTMHIMNDYDGNCYVWTTSAKHWEPETEHHIKGTVKEHKIYKGTKQTVLIRCRELAD